jgi:hypothetical protein
MPEINELKRKFLREDKRFSRAELRKSLFPLGECEIYSMYCAVSPTQSPNIAVQVQELRRQAMKAPIVVMEPQVLINECSVLGHKI